MNFKEETYSNGGLGNEDQKTFTALVIDLAQVQTPGEVDPLRGD